MSAFYDQASLVVVPSGYKSGKIYAQKPLTTDGQLTFTRASTATRVNASGLIETVASGVPRLDYQGSTCPKLLLEKQSTNYFTGSSALPDTGWTSAGATFTTGQTDPSGGTGGLRVQFAAGSSFFLRLFGYAAGVSYARSVYMKASTPQTIRFEDPATGFGVTANLTTAWQRFSFAQVVTTGMGVQFANSTDSAAKDFVIAFPQIEESTYATSFIPTTSSAVTRLADACSKTGISSLIGQTEGTLFTDFVVNGLQNFGTPISVNDGSTNNYVWLTIFGNGTLRAEVFNTSGVQATLAYSGAVVGGRYKMAFAYKANDFVLYVNGALIQSSNSGSTFSGSTLSRVDFDITNPSSFSLASESINQALVFKTRLTNAQLAELTSL